MTVVEKSVVVQTSLTIDASPDRVWAVFADLERWGEWNPVCSNATAVSGQLWKPGAVFRFTIKPWWRAITFQATVIESSPPSRVLWLGKGGGIYGQQTFTFEPDDGGARVTSYEVFSGPMLGLMPLFAPSAKVREDMARWLEALKARVEAR